MKLTEELVMYIISWGKSMNTNTYCKYVKFIDMACTRAVTMSQEMMILRNYDDTIILRLNHVEQQSQDAYLNIFTKHQ